MKSIEPIQDFVFISATVAAVPRHRRAPQPINLTVKFSGGVSASWQRSLEEVRQAATNVWQQLSEVSCFTLGPCQPPWLFRLASNTGLLHGLRNRPCRWAWQHLLAFQLHESDNLINPRMKATRCRNVCGTHHLRPDPTPYSCLCVSPVKAHSYTVPAHSCRCCTETKAICSASLLPPAAIAMTPAYARLLRFLYYSSLLLHPSTAHLYWAVNPFPCGATFSCVCLQTAGQCLRRNFLAMLDSTSQVDAHALAPTDISNAAALQQLSQPAQSLLLRLLLRKGPWFRVRALAYEDVPDVDANVAELLAARLLIPATPRLATPFTSPEQDLVSQGALWRCWLVCCHGTLG